MVQVYRTGTGAELAATSVISYLRCALRETQKRFEERRAKMSANDVLLCNDLFSCLIPNSRTAEGQWLRRTIANIEYWGFERVLDGTAIDHAAVPLSIGSIRYLATGYALGRQGLENDYAGRKFAIISLWAACGRSGELAYVHWDNLAWDASHECIVATIPQVKTSKSKKICFVAGADRGLCWILSLGDHWAASGWNAPEGDEGEPSWVFPDLHARRQAGTKVGSFVACARDGRWELTSEIPPEMSNMSSMFHTSNMPHMLKTLTPLPERATAAGVRKGAVDLMATYLPNELVVASTGHDLSSISALDSYIQADAAKAMPGAVVLAGYAPFPWGQRGKGPTPASWELLVAFVGGDEGVLEEFASELFYLGAADTALQVGGRLRPLVRAALATQVMYYPERVHSGEFPGILQRTLKLFSRGAYHSTSMTQSPRHTLLHWGERLRSRFASDNFTLVNPARGASDASSELVGLLQGLITSVGSLQNRMDRLAAYVENVVNVENAANVSGKSPTKGKRVVENVVNVEDAANVAGKSPTKGKRRRTQAQGSIEGTSSDSSDDSDGATAQPLRLKSPSGGGGPGDEHIVALKQMKATVYVRNVKTGLMDPANIPSRARQLRFKARATVDCFTAVASVDELTALGNKKDANFKKVAEALEERVRYRLHKICVERGMSEEDVPGPLRPGTPKRSGRSGGKAHSVWRVTTIDTARCKVKTLPGFKDLDIIDVLLKGEEFANVANVASTSNASNAGHSARSSATPTTPRSPSQGMHSLLALWKSS